MDTRIVIPNDTASIATGRPMLVCLSHLRWDFVWQRPHHLLSRAVQSYDVVYVEEPVIADGPPCFMMRHTPSGVRVAYLRVPPDCSTTEIVSLMQSHLAELIENRRRVVLWFYTPLAVPYASTLDSDFAVYDCMDDLQSFKGASAELGWREGQLMKRVQLVLAGGRTLFNSRKTAHSNVHLFPSSIDVSHFAKARNRPADPVDQGRIGRPRIGFFGVIDERMDLELVEGMCALRPAWNFVMLGPTAKIDPAKLPKAANLHWLGPKSYEALPDYLGNWDAGFMPFARNAATRHISPTKTPEFLAAGLPLVSTSIADVCHDYGHLVQFADRPDSFVEALENVLRPAPRGWLAEVDRTLASSSWDRTWADIDGLISPHLGILHPEGACHV